jgi:TonB family protein
MKIKQIAGLVVAAYVTVMTGYAQTAAEQMQKGIYTQETVGDLDGAIAIYRQIVNSGSSPRDLAAEAQYRLAQILLQKGDLSNAAQEFDKLARSYADYGQLVSRMASMARGNTYYFPGRSGIGGRGGNVNLTDQERMDRQRAELESVIARVKAEIGSGTATADANLTPEQNADRAKQRLAIVQKQLEALNLQQAERLGGRGGAPPPAPPGTLRVGSTVQEANLLSKTPPAYPPLARAAHVQGTVRFDATIGKDGRVENLQLISGPPLLVQAGMDAVRQWVYKPVLLNGQPVPVVTTIDINFTLTE